MVLRRVLGSDGSTAELECLHRVPVTDEETVDCERCDRAELPDGLELARTAGPFDAHDLPAGLRRDHRVGPRTWGRLRVEQGAVHFSMQTDPPIERRLEAGDSQPIPPGVPHHLTVAGPMVVAVDFLVRPPEGR